MIQPVAPFLARGSIGLPYGLPRDHGIMVVGVDHDRRKVLTADGRTVTMDRVWICDLANLYPRPVGVYAA